MTKIKTKLLMKMLPNKYKRSARPYSIRSNIHQSVLVSRFDERKTRKDLEKQVEKSCYWVLGGRYDLPHGRETAAAYKNPVKTR